MRGSLNLLALLSALAIPPAHAQKAPLAESYRIDEHGGGLGMFIDQTLAFAAVSGKRWVAERTRHARNWCGDRSGGTCKQTDIRTHDWIDSASCPQVVDLLRDLSAITPPRFASPDATNYWLSADTTLLTIAGRRESTGPISGIGGEESLSISEISGPYRTWWQKTEKMLEGCWKTEAPLADGKPVAARLAEQP